VELSWEVNSTLQSKIGNFKIYRRPVGNSSTPTLIASANSSSTLYIDNSANAGVLYEYFVIAEGSCENATIKSYSGSMSAINSSSAGVAYGVGFRSATATVSGQIVFEGGTGVRGVKMKAVKSSGANGTSLYLDGTASISVPHQASLNPTAELTVEAWVKPVAVSGTQVIVKKSDGANGYGLELNGSNAEFWVYVGGIKKTASYGVTAGAYHQLTGVFDGDSIKLYVSGVKRASLLASGTVTSSTAPLYIGADNTTSKLTGHLDEVRIWNVKKSQETVVQDFDRRVDGGAVGLIAYWNMDENVGSNTYDQSKTGDVYNENHGTITSGFSWTTVVPNELSNAAYTDAGGNYTISNIRFTGNGETFTITPILVPHVFTPATKNIFLGESSNVVNNQDFLDESSFKVAGRVLYDPDFHVFNGNIKVGQELPVADVFILVDDVPLIAAGGQPVRTAADGSYDIRVPIGQHSISVSKPGHSFSLGRLTDNFLADEPQPIIFKDTTTQTVVGRVVGGNDQANKEPGLSRSKNNIGVARLEYLSENGNYTAKVTTDSLTGEYIVRLPPYKYTAQPFTITNPEPDIEFSAVKGFDMNMDVSGSLPLLTTLDTVVVGGVAQVNSLQYHKQKDFVYYAPPSLIGINAEGNTGHKFIGADKIKVGGAEADVSGLPYAVFEQAKDYGFTFRGAEFYRNYDNSSQVLIDTVLIKNGKIQISNQLAINTVETLELNEVGESAYTFKAGIPNVSKNPTFADQSFTRTFTAKLEVFNAQGTKVGEADWKPDPAGVNTIFRGFVFGVLQDGSTFATQGPSVVEFILRDPPGSNSTATLAKGTSFTRSVGYSLAGSVSQNWETTINAGTQFEAGIIGFSTETKVEADVSKNTSIAMSINQEGQFEETVTVEREWTTNGDPFLVGAPGDLFIGRARAFVFGIGTNVQLINQANCSLPGVECYDMPAINVGGTNYVVGTSKSLAMAPGGKETMFLITQNAILNLEIPRLKLLRDKLFESAKYIDKLSGDEAAGYGRNNDDDFFGASAGQTITDNADGTKTHDGISYTFHNPNLPLVTENINGSPVVKQNPANVDSVRWYNQQIKLWQEAIARNEQEKYEAIKAGGGEAIIYSATGTEASNTRTVEKTKAFSVGVELTVANEIITSAGVEVAGSGVSATGTLSMEFSAGTSLSTTSTNTVSVGYTLLDTDEDDRYLLEVFNSPQGNGPIFTIAGGETSCPYEGEVKSLFYKDPNTKDFVTLSAATVQRERPTIAINGSTLVTNVPEDEAAIFEVRLGNSNSLGQRMIYHLAVDGNEFGAIVKVDGQIVDTDFAVDAQSTVNKVITVEKGPGATFEYDDIVLQFHSPCQFSDGTSSDQDIFEQITIQAHFIPTCTQSELVQPQNNFVVNYEKNSQLPIKVGGYDINSPTFEKFQVQYKPSFSSAWTTIETYWKDADPLFPDRKIIPRTSFTTDFIWELPPSDGYYDVRVMTYCTDGTVSESPVMSGLVDRFNPRPFGTPSPADGILSPNDDIVIRFNEVIDEGILNPSNFDIRGVLNGSALDHNTSIRYDGTSGYSEIPDGVNLAGTSFSIEMWVRRDQLGTAQTLFEQGSTTDESIYIGFDASNRLVFRVAGDEIVTNTTHTDTDWKHYAFVFDKANATGIIYKQATKIIDFVSSKTSLSNEYRGDGIIRLGRSTEGADRYFSGNIHELRLWTRVRDDAAIAPSINKLLTGREQGLVGNWPMDEGDGMLARDIARSRNASVNAIWQIEPSGQSQSFTGTGLVVADGATVSANDEMDFTVEFWFKVPSAGDYVFFSNGKGNGTDGNGDGWAIGSTSTGEIMVYHNSTSFEAVSNTTNYFDDQWHHFAFVVNRIGNATAFIDGNQKNIMQSEGFKGFGGPKIGIGARYYSDGAGSYIQQNHLVGSLDEVRVWNMARLQAQIARDRLNRLTGDEPGLLGYWPFEEYSLDVFDRPQLTPTLEDQSMSLDPTTLTYVKNGNDGVVNGTGVAYSGLVPPIKLQRPVKSILFDFVANQDEIVLTPKVDAYFIENVTLDITVKNIRDLAGNLLQSPKTWIAYIDKNQVFWNDVDEHFDKESGQDLIFTNQIVNSGGASKDFTISNIPPWLTISPSSGTISPNSQKTVTFSVNKDLNIGQYSNSINLTTDFGFDEVFLLSLNVYENPPKDWVYNETQFQYTMSLIAQLEVDGVISIDPNDRLGAFVNGENRGYVNLKYVESLDKYMAFLNIYSNNALGESIEFRIWDASQGRVYTQVQPGYTFEADTRKGEVLTPVLMQTQNLVQKILPVVNGWQWLSFNLSSSDFTNVNDFMATVEAQNGDQIKGSVYFDQYDPDNGWIGTISGNGGLKNGELYKVRVTQPGDLVFEGAVVDPGTVSINVAPGWNWIGFIALRNMEINEALSNYNAQTGDEIKSQKQFAVYGGSAHGWLGTLESLSPGQGFMLKSTQSSTFVYPKETLNNGRVAAPDYSYLTDGSLTVNVEQYSENMSAIMQIKNLSGDLLTDTLIAMVDGQVRGIALPRSNPELTEPSYFMTISGLGLAEKIEFVALDGEELSSLASEEQVYFGTNTSIGTLKEPIVLIKSTESKLFGDLEIFPNPFTDMLNVRLGELSGEQVIISIHDITGRLLYRDQVSNTGHWFWDGTNQNSQILSKGVYTISVEAGGEVSSHKIIKE